eukprot:COSAG02_NODE_2342_length_9101_cov_78.830038_8_plen_637_part_00
MAPNFYVLDPEHYRRRLRAAFGWARKNVPFVDVEDEDVLTAYYYRWRSYRKHIRPTPNGYVVTEFYQNVPWSGMYNSLPDAAGHHIMEGRWIHDETYLNDYILFWFGGGGDPYQYTNWIGWASWQRWKVNGNTSFISGLLPRLIANYKAFPAMYTAYAGAQRCWWIDAGNDAMEDSISGGGCRPTLASALFGEAAAISLISAVTNQNQTYPSGAWAAFAQSVVMNLHWNPAISSFAVVPGVACPGGCNAPANPPGPAPPPAPPSPPMPSDFRPVFKGIFCCDQHACPNKRTSKWLFQGAVSQTVCLQKCAEQGARCNFVTLDRSKPVGGYVHYCQVSEYCNQTGPYGVPLGENRSNVITYRRDHAMLDAAESVVQKPVAPRRLSTIATGSHRSSCNLGAIRVPNKTVNVRELLGFMPWYFSDGYGSAQLVPPVGYGHYAVMFRQLNDPSGFKAKWGLTTAERRSPCYNYTWQHGDTWNQNSWPYETARVLTGFANVLNDYPGEHADVSAELYHSLLVQYARQHTRTTAVNDTADPVGSGHVFENLHPDLGYWNNRAILFACAHNTNQSKADQEYCETYREQGDDYNHSTFIVRIKVPSFAPMQCRLHLCVCVCRTWCYQAFSGYGLNEIVRSSSIR